MSYKESYLTGKALADKIRSGEFKRERESKLQEPSVGLLSRRQSQTEQTPSSDKAFYEALLASYMAASAPKQPTQTEEQLASKPSKYAPGTPEKSLSSKDVDLGRIASGIREAATELGVDPVDLATVVSYETAGTFNPTKHGPTTQWGQHKGLIQFGEPQAQEYGVNWEDPYGSQLGANGAIVNYLRKNGVTPGMGLLDMYSTVNAGAPGLYDRSDANNGGAPGTVRDKVEQQMSGHKQKAVSLMGKF